MVSLLTMEANIQPQKISDQNLSLADLSFFLEEKTANIQAQLLKLDPKWKNRSSVPPHLVRKILVKNGYRLPKQVVSFQMLKGGVAKTTSALNFGWRASHYGARVLFIDLDQQANLTFALGVEAENKPVWVDIIEKKTEIEKAIIPIGPQIDLIPSSLNNSVLDRVLLNGNRNWAQAVKGPLKEIIGNYDLVVIDTAPNLSAINTAVTCASDLVVLPINPDKFSMIGLKKNLQDLKDLRKEFDLGFEEKILFTRFDGRESSSQVFLSECMNLFEDLLLKHYVRTSTEIKNAIGGPRSVFTTKNNAKEDYDGVTRELLGFWKES